MEVHDHPCSESLIELVTNYAIRWRHRLPIQKLATWLF